MKKKMKNTLLSVLFSVAATTAVSATALLIQPTKVAQAETQTTRFEMVDGASIRFSSPLGMRFIAELGQQEYNDLTTAEDGVTKKMGMLVMPYDFIDTNTDGTIDVTDYMGVATKLNYTFYASDGSGVDAELYTVTDENGDTYYRANGVISNLKLQNYAREFVGIGYIAETKNGDTTYEYTDITYNDNVRTAAYVAIEAHADPDYSNINNAMAAFTQYIDGAQLFSAYNVTQNDNGKYVYNTAEYNTLAEIKGTIENYAYGISLDKSVKYVKADGTAQLTATLSDTLNNVTFKGAHAVYSSSDESVVKVDKTGKLSWVKNGTATIKATFMGKTQTCEVISGAIDFNDGNSLSSYFLNGGRTTLAVVDGNGGKVLQATIDNSGSDGIRIKTPLDYIGAFFEDESVQYMAFDVKLPEDETDGVIVYQNANQSDYTKYETSQFDTAPTDAYKTYYFPRSVYEAWVENGKTEGIFLNVQQVINLKSIWIDNIRPVTADEYTADLYSFETGSLRNMTTEIGYCTPSNNQFHFKITNVNAATAKFTNEIVFDGMRAIQFTKIAGESTISFNDNSDPSIETEMRDAGYVAFDLYVPDGSDVKISKGGAYGALKEGWNTICEKVPATDNGLIYFTDTTASTYVIDNFRLLTEDEYNASVCGFEAGGVLLDRSSDNYYQYYGGADKMSFSTHSIKVEDKKDAGLTVRLDSEIAHSGDYSLAIEHKGETYFWFDSSSEMYSLMKNGFTCWVYTTATLDNVRNGNNANGVKIAANTWTKVTMTADDIHSTAYRFMMLMDAVTCTVYIDDLQPLVSSTITYDAGEGTVESTTQTVVYGEQYTLKTPTFDREFLGWYNGDELVPTTGTWSIEGDVTLTARYADNYYNATVGETDENGVINGITLNGGTHNATSGMPVAATNEADMAYYRMGGDYGLNDFLVFDFTGDNMPILSFFTTEVTNSVYNHAQSDTNKGWIFFNGIWNGSTPDGGFGTLSSRLNMIGPYKITYKADDSWATGKDGSETPVSSRVSDGSTTASPNPVSLAQLYGSTDEYRMIIGWVENGTYMNLRILVWNLTTEEIVVDFQEGEISKADWTGDIVLYGHFGKATTVDKLYPVVEGLDNALALYTPTTVRYNTTWDGDDLILAASSYEGEVVAPTSSDMSYIAFNGTYGMNDFVVFDITGDNMPFVSFFNNQITNTVFNPANDTSVSGWVIMNGLHQGDGSIWGSGTDNAMRLLAVGPSKINDVTASTNNSRYPLGSASDPNLLSIDKLQGVTDTYRVIIGWVKSERPDKQYIQIGVINMVTGEEIYRSTTDFSVWTTDCPEGSIILHGQFGKTTVLDRVFGVEENTTLDALLEKYATKDSDYSDEEAVVLDRYAYASLSNGQWQIDGENQVANPTDYRENLNSYTTYANAGFNIVLAQDMINPDVDEATWEAEGKKYMDLANQAGLKVILTDWHLQILSKPITPTSDGLTVSNTTYLPWIIGTDASATDGLAKEWLDVVSGMGLTMNTTRFVSRDALDNYVRDQLALYKDHSAFYGVMLGDEPSYHNAYCYSEIYKSIKRVMPECYVQYNLMPMESDTAAIERYYTGVANDDATSAEIEVAYTQYVERFLDAMGTDYIQYDDYPFKSATDGIWFWETTTPYVDPTSLRNIQLVAEIAKERGLAVKVVTQSSMMRKGGANGDVFIRQITENDARWLNNYLMGFGVKQINYFTYWTKYANSSTGEYYEDGGSFVNHDGTTTAVYDFMKTIMANNTAFAPTISHFDYNASQVVGSNNGDQNNEHISWSSSLTADVSFRFVTSVSTSLEYTLVTELYDKDNYNYMYMVMNTIDPNEGGAQSVTVTFDSSITQIYVYDQTGARTAVTLTDNAYTVTLTAGQAVYLLPY